MQGGRGQLGSGAGDVQEVRLLTCVIRWTPRALLYDSDPRHAEQLARDLEAVGERVDPAPLSSRGLRRGAELTGGAVCPTCGLWQMALWFDSGAR